MSGAESVDEVFICCSKYERRHHKISEESSIICCIAQCPPVPESGSDPSYLGGIETGRATDSSNRRTPVSRKAYVVASEG